MIREHATAAEVRNAFVAPDAEAAIRDLTTIIGEKLDMETSLDLMLKCIDVSEGMVDEDSKPHERVMWLVRQAFLFGFSYAAQLHYEAAEAGYNALFYGEPPSKT